MGLAWLGQKSSGPPRGRIFTLNIPTIGTITWNIPTIGTSPVFGVYNKVIGLFCGLIFFSIIRPEFFY